ncbi:MAG: hypothetical protein AB1424_13750 [Thermodesulfobacteriota bacterium]
MAWKIGSVSPYYPVKQIANQQREFDRQEKRQKFIEKVVERRLKMGNELLNEGLYELAEKEFTEALSLDQNEYRAELGKLKSRVYHSAGEYDCRLIRKRLKELTEVCSRPGKDPEKLSEVNSKPGKDPEKPKTADDPEDPGVIDDPHVLIFWGDIFVRQDEKDKAIKFFEKAKEKDKNVTQAYDKLGFLYREKSNKDEALINFIQAAEKSKWNSKYLNNLASQYADMDKLKDATDYYQRAIKMDPDYILPFLKISNVFRRGSSKDARTYLEEARRYLQAAVIRLENQRVADLTKNKGGWVFNSDNVSGRKTETFTELPEKKAYAYLSMALTLHLLDEKSECLCYFEKARGLKLQTMPKIMSVVRQDHARLPDEIKKNSDFPKILKREMLTSQ